jgi:hypothetical protein
VPSGIHGCIGRTRYGCSPLDFVAVIPCRSVRFSLSLRSHSLFLPMKFVARSHLSIPAMPDSLDIRWHASVISFASWDKHSASSSDSQHPNRDKIVPRLSCYPAIRTHIQEQLNFIHVLLFIGRSLSPSSRFHSIRPCFRKLIQQQQHLVTPIVDLKEQTHVVYFYSAERGF